MDAHAILEQLAFVLRSVAEDASGVTGLPQDIAAQLNGLASRIAGEAGEMERIASVLKPRP